VISRHSGTTPSTMVHERVSTGTTNLDNYCVADDPPL
jgi:hypothetical protein